MKRGLFDVFAAISLIIAVALALGYTASFGLGWNGLRVSGGASVQMCSHSLRLDTGRVVLWLEPWHPPVYALVPASGFAWRGSPLPSRLPDIRRSVWEFDAHRVGTGAFILACPIWCIAAPLLLVLLSWWRTRSKLQSPAGFEVLSGAPSEQAGSMISRGLSDG